MQLQVTSFSQMPIIINFKRNKNRERLNGSNQSIDMPPFVIKNVYDVDDVLHHSI
jgi:hypothetical protein